MELRENLVSREALGWTSKPTRGKLENIADCV